MVQDHAGFFRRFLKPKRITRSFSVKKFMCSNSSELPGGSSMTRLPNRFRRKRSSSAMETDAPLSKSRLYRRKGSYPPQERAVPCREIPASFRYSTAGGAGNLAGWRKTRSQCELSFPAGGFSSAICARTAFPEFFEIGVRAVTGKAGYGRFRTSDASGHIPMLMRIKSCGLAMI